MVLAFLGDLSFGAAELVRFLPFKVAFFLFLIGDFAGFSALDGPLRKAAISSGESTFS